MYYNAIVRSLHTGKTRTFTVIANKRKAQSFVRTWARRDGFTGRLKVRLIRHDGDPVRSGKTTHFPAHTASGSMSKAQKLAHYRGTYGANPPAKTMNPSLAAPFRGGPVSAEDVYGEAAASVFPVTGPEEYLPKSHPRVVTLDEGSALPKTTEISVPNNASTFPVVVKRVTPQEDPTYKSVRFHVKDAQGRTIKNCKTLKEAEETASRINFAEGVKDRCDALTHSTN